MSPDEAAIAEALVQQGYHTGFFGDMPHYFVPGMNFTRGFNQWQYIRGHAEDRYNARPTPTRRSFRRYWGRPNGFRAHLVNVRPEQPGGDLAGRHAPSVPPCSSWNRTRATSPSTSTSTASRPMRRGRRRCTTMTSTAAARIASRSASPFPTARSVCAPQYEARLASIRANYAGLVTMVDAWFGKLIDTIDRLGLRENTLVIFLSDHGTNFADNPERIIGKPEYAMYPGTMDIPLIARHPEGKGAGTVNEELVYTLDVPATVLDADRRYAVGRDRRPEPACR